MTDVIGDLNDYRVSGHPMRTEGRPVTPIRPGGAPSRDHMHDDDIPPPGDEDFRGVRGNGFDPRVDPRDVPKPPRVGESPASIAQRWATAGEVRRVSTGIAPLDALCRGGFPVPRRIAIVGAPGAGKTYVLVCMADTMARAEDGLCVGILAADEDPDDQCVRLAQRAGYSSGDLDRRDPETMLALSTSLARLRLRFYDASWTIDAAGADVLGWAKAEGRPGALCIDSIQTVASDASNMLERRDPRHVVEANLGAVRALSDHGLLVAYSSEANRSAYRNGGKGEQADIAAGAESRAIEFGCQTQLVLRTPAGHDDVVHITVPKNRREQRSSDGFFLRLDRARHELAECEDPTATTGDEGAHDSARQARERARIDRAADEIVKLVSRNPGQGERGLRALAKLGGFEIGIPAWEAAKALLQAGRLGVRLVNRGSKQRSAWFIESVQEGPSDES